MTSIIDVKKKIRDILLADQIVSAIVGTHVFIGWIERGYMFPCVSIVDVSDQAEVSGLNQGFDGVNRYQWHYAVIQVDCWSSKSAEERNQLKRVVQKCLLRSDAEDVFHVQEVTAQSLNEFDVKPPIWRMSLRYNVTYVLEVLA
jgi:hypothetical protein